MSGPRAIGGPRLWTHGWTERGRARRFLHMPKLRGTHAARARYPLPRTEVPEMRHEDDENVLTERSITCQEEIELGPREWVR